MTLLTVSGCVTCAAFAGIGPRLDGMIKLEIAPVHPLLNRVSALMTIYAEHLVRMALNAVLWIKFRICLML